MKELITTSISGSDSSFILTKWIGSTIDAIHYFSHDFWNQSGDPRVLKYPMMEGGPWSTISLIMMYLYFVKIAGPQLMKGRKAFDLRSLIFSYNCALVILNGWFFYTGCWISNFGIESWKCQLVDYKSKNWLDLYKIRIGWIFYMSKIIDLCDTVFFVLRKKDTQITPLHVVHHSCMPLLCWVGVKFAAGGNNAFFPWINSGVHTIMYSYYALSTFESAKPYLWWKKYITKIQMAQFILVIVHSLYSMAITGCKWPRVFMYLSIFNAFLFLCMFYSFFQRTYNNAKCITGRSASAINTVTSKSLVAPCYKEDTSSTSTSSSNSTCTSSSTSSLCTNSSLAPINSSSANSSGSNECDQLTTGGDDTCNSQRIKAE